MNTSKLTQLIKHPIHGSKKIASVVSSSLINTRRRAFESLGNGKYSIVYEGHDELLKYLGSKRNGFFIESGAYNGLRSDPTYYLEKLLGWKGILVEPLPGAYKACMKNRKRSKVYNCALVPDGFREPTIKMMDCKLMSIVKEMADYKDWIKEGESVQKIISKEIEVPARTLNQILNEYFSKGLASEIDLLVLDVEGYEINVLKGLDLDKYAPKNLLLEIQNDSRKTEIESYLGKRYKLVSKIGFADYFYKRT
jgi:FkbM family methyltransferase